MEHNMQLNDILDEVHGWEEASPPRPIRTRNVEKEARPRARPLRHAGSVLLNVLIVILLVSALLLRASPGEPPRSVFGFSIFRVLTSSMQREIPKDSIIITRRVDPLTLEVGDTITYLRADFNTVTHKIMKVYPEGGPGDVVAFQTKGVENNLPDADLVLAPNVIGKVVFHSSALGAGLRFIREYGGFLIIFLILLALSAGLFLSLRSLFSFRRKRYRTMDDVGTVEKDGEAFFVIHHEVEHNTTLREKAGIRK